MESDETIEKGKSMKKKIFIQPLEEGWVGRHS